MSRLHALKSDTVHAASKGATRSATYEIHDGARVVDSAERRSDVMRAAKRLPLGTTCGRSGESPTFTLTERGWLFTG